MERRRGGPVTIAQQAAIVRVTLREDKAELSELAEKLIA
jgi:hypothetical protein